MMVLQPATDPMADPPHTLASLGLTGGQEDRPITGLALASHAVREGNLFAALPGVLTHGAHHAMDAIARGAVAILTDADGAMIIPHDTIPETVPVYVHTDPRATLATLAARWYNQRPETIVAVTGTNGKTSVADMCRQLWDKLGYAAASMGTTGIAGAYAAPAGLTTPDPLTLHRHLHAMGCQGVTHLAMEASSHGLDQSRLDGLRFACAAFTNLSHDHLDYHATFDAYRAAKQILFERLLAEEGAAVIWMNDPNSEAMLTTAGAHADRVLRVGLGTGDLNIIDQRPTHNGQEIRFCWQGAPHECRIELLGRFQVHNLLVAAAMTIATGARPEAIFAALDSVRTVPGRMECVAWRANRSALIVDFAHTPAALETALVELRQHFRGDLHVVFGAGGDRDSGKRTPMGRVAARCADHVTVTDDNPRGEDPAAIRQAILAGCPEAAEIGDRSEAILVAASRLAPGDALLIAGKGHETGQIIGTTTIPYNDTEQASMVARLLDGKGI